MSKGRQDEAEASEGAKWLAEERITREDLVLSAHPPRHSGTLSARQTRWIQMETTDGIGPVSVRPCPPVASASIAQGVS